MKQDFLALILAAGEGTRFKSDKIKVLHTLMGKPMLRLVVDCISRLRPAKTYVVVGYQKEAVIKEVQSKNIGFVVQRKQLGTAHAVLAAKQILRKEANKDLLIINADLPLLRAETLRPFLTQHHREGNSLTFLSADLDNPTGFGRVLRSENKIEKIIEEKDATPSQRKIKEINAGVYIFKIKDLFKALPKVSNINKKGEYYLTDVIEILIKENKKVGLYKSSLAEEVIGINDRYELAKAADILRERKIKSLAEDGVTVYDPATTWIDLDVKIGRDTTLYSSVIIEGNSVLGHQCQIYPFVHIVDCKIGDRVKILSSTMIEGSRIKNDAQVGPFTHFRPKTVIQEGAKVGNFVEMKNTVFGKKSKAGHLTYLGDSKVGGKVNIGAGTITCNYDGLKKHRTLIEEGAFIGSGTELVAPIKVGKNSYVGAGSTITKNVSAGRLAVCRSKQVEKSGWMKRANKQRNKKKKK